MRLILLLLLMLVSFARAQAQYVAPVLSGQKAAALLNGQTVQGVTIGSGSIGATVTTPTEVYGAGWNGDDSLPTKDAIYDYLAATLGSGTGLDALPDGAVMGAIATGSWTIRPGINNGETLTIGGAVTGTGNVTGPRIVVYSATGTPGLTLYNPTISGHVLGGSTNDLGDGGGGNFRTVWAQGLNIFNGDNGVWESSFTGYENGHVYLNAGPAFDEFDVLNQDGDGTLHLGGITINGTTASANGIANLGATYAQMRTNLGLVIGTNVQAFDSDLTGWAAKTPYAGSLAIQTGTTTTIVSSITIGGDPGAELDVAGGGTLGTAAFENTTVFQPADPELNDWAAVNAPAAVRTALGIAPNTSGGFMTYGGAGSHTNLAISGTVTVEGATPANDGGTIFAESGSHVFSADRRVMLRPGSGWQVTSEGIHNFSSGTAGAPGIAWSSDADGTGTGFYRTAANEIGLAHNGSLVTTFTSGGITTNAITWAAGQITSFNGGGYAILRPAGGADGRLGATGNNSDSWTSLSLKNTGFIDWAHGTFITSEAAAIVQFGVDATSPINQGVKAPDKTTSDGNGAEYDVSGGSGRGGEGGDVTVSTYTTGASGAAGTKTVRVRVDGPTGEQTNTQTLNAPRFEISSAYPVPCVLFSNVTPVGNVGSGEDDLQSNSVPANTFSANGDCVVWKTRHANQAAVQAWYVAGTPLVSSYEIEQARQAEFSDLVAATIELVRLDSDSLLVTISWISQEQDTPDSGEPGRSFSSQQQIDGLTFSNAIVVKTTGTGTLSNDVVQSWSQAMYQPAP